MADYVTHIDHVVGRVGIDHVGIGMDFDHRAGIVGFRDAGEAPNLTRALLERGYSADDIAKDLERQRHARPRSSRSGRPVTAVDAACPFPSLSD